MSNIIVLDLEMEQPSNEIIQIGYVIGDKAGKIKHQRSILVKPSQQLSDFIIDLTGITRDRMDSEGVSKAEAMEIMNKDLAKYSPNKKAVTWGSGDVRVLLQQFPEITLHNRYLDMKTLYQMESLATNRSMKRGLFNAAEDLDINTDMFSAHDALSDAIVTYLVFIEYINKFKRLNKVDTIYGF